MVDKTPERDALLGQALIEKQIPRAYEPKGPRLFDAEHGNFR